MIANTRRFPSWKLVYNSNENKLNTHFNILSQQSYTFFSKKSLLISFTSWWKIVLVLTTENNKYGFFRACGNSMLYSPVTKRVLINRLTKQRLLDIAFLTSCIMHMKTHKGIIEAIWFVKRFPSIWKCKCQVQCAISSQVHWQYRIGIFRYLIFELWF